MYELKDKEVIIYIEEFESAQVGGLVPIVNPHHTEPCIEFNFPLKKGEFFVDGWVQVDMPEKVDQESTLFTDREMMDDGDTIIKLKWINIPVEELNKIGCCCECKDCYGQGCEHSR